MCINWLTLLTGKHRDAEALNHLAVYRYCWQGINQFVDVQDEANKLTL